MKGWKKLQLPPLRPRISLPLHTSLSPVFRESTLQIATSKLLQKLNPNLRMSPESLYLKHEQALRQTLFPTSSPYAKRQKPEKRQSVVDCPLMTNKIEISGCRVARCKFPAFSHRSKSQLHPPLRKLANTQDAGTYAFPTEDPNRQVVYQNSQGFKFLTPVSSNSSLANKIKPKLD